MDYSNPPCYSNIPRESLASLYLSILSRLLLFKLEYRQTYVATSPSTVYCSVLNKLHIPSGC